MIQRLKNLIKWSKIEPPSEFGFYARPNGEKILKMPRQLAQIIKKDNPIETFLENNGPI